MESLYLHLEQDSVILKKNIIGIFDMDKTTVKRLSCITLIIMGFGGLLLAVSEICGGFLPDIAVRIIGIADIICLTLFVFLFVLVSRK